MKRPEQLLCQGTTLAGNPCKAFAMDDGSGYCFAHNPKISDEQRHKWNVKGGKATRKHRVMAEVVDGNLMRILVDGELDVPLETLEDIKAFANVEIARLRERSLDRPPTIQETNSMRLWTETILKLWEREAILDIRDQMEVIEARQLQLASEKGVAFVGRAVDTLKNKLLSSNIIDVEPMEVQDVKETNEQQGILISFERQTGEGARQARGTSEEEQAAQRPDPAEEKPEASNQHPGF